MSAVATLLSGSLFGASLLYSGVASPQTILSQLRLKDFHMLQTFLTASSISSLITHLNPWLPARGPAPTNVLLSLGGGGGGGGGSGGSIVALTPYDANILGGILQGVGMALSGACPGTGLVQLGAGLRSGAAFVAGGMLGAWLFRAASQRAATMTGATTATTATTAAAKDNDKTASKTTTIPTLPALLHLSPAATLALWQTLCIALVLATSTYLPSSPPSFSSRSSSSSSTTNTTTTPLSRAVSGGIAIGAAQALSVLLRGSLVGVSGGYGQAVDAIASLVPYHPHPHPPQPYNDNNNNNNKKTKKPALDTRATQFALGVLLGAAVLSALVPGIGGIHGAFSTPWSSSSFSSSVVAVPDASAFVGGVLQIFGARLAGGCTSGHGISGLATWGLASFVTVGANFAGGMGVVALLG